MQPLALMLILWEDTEALAYLGDYCTPVKGDKQLLFPIVTVEVQHLASDVFAKRQNQHNAAIMVRNLRKLRQQAGMSEGELKDKFDGIAHVITISFTQTKLRICYCWSVVAADGHLEFFQKSVASADVEQGLNSFQAMVDKIRNAIDWVTDFNKQWIQDDLAKLQPLVSQLPPLMPEVSVVGSSAESEVLDE